MKRVALLVLFVAAALVTTACADQLWSNEAGEQSRADGQPVNDGMPGGVFRSNPCGGATAADDGCAGFKALKPLPILPAFEVDANEEPGPGLLKTFTGAGGWKGIALQESGFEVHVVGTVAETKVTQLFANPFQDVIEAVYTFPLPENGAVDAYWIQIGDHRIKGVMKKRAEAKEIYEQAKSEGRNAGLLEQERPNIFTTSVANIPPGASILVELNLVQPLTQEDDSYQLVLPTTIGPRFIPGKRALPEPSGTGWSLDTERVPDASRITPPVVGEGQRTGNDLSILVEIDAGAPVYDLVSKFHDVEIAKEAQGAFVRLAAHETVANRDFVLRWKLQGPQAQALLLAQNVDDQGFFTLSLQPPAQAPPTEPMGRELIFVLDSSCSMSGVPMETAKAAMRLALEQMRPTDSFNVLDFSDSVSGLSKNPIAATASNRSKARQYVDNLQGSGGTQMLEGIKAALSMPATDDQERMRIVLFLTDGYIGNETEIFDAIAARLGTTRLFSLGVGSSVNRYLLDGMARMGRGAVTYMGPNEAGDKVVQRFYERIAYPVLTDIEIDWGGLKVADVVPALIPDVFLGQAITVFGRFEGAAAGQVVVRGRMGSRWVELPIEVEASKLLVPGKSLASTWARQRIRELLEDPEHMKNQAAAGDEQQGDRFVAQVIKLALQHSIMTEYTSFVAVDEERIVAPGGGCTTVTVPVEMPEGVSYQGFGEEISGAGAGGLGTMQGRGRSGGVGYGSGMGGMGAKGSGAGGGGMSLGLGSNKATTQSARPQAPTAPSVTTEPQAVVYPETERSDPSLDGLNGAETGQFAPPMQSGEPLVLGSLDKSSIQRVIKQHLSEIRFCYDRELLKNPNLSGKVVVKFTIDSDGKVLKVEIQSSTLANSVVESCVLGRFAKFVFPQPGGGIVVVSYPLVFEPGS